MTVFEKFARTLGRVGGLLPLALGAAIVLGAPGDARAKVTCQNNADCFETAQQCDPGGIPCNDGVCDPLDPIADAFGCVLIPNDGNCDDGLFCNGSETCDVKHGCRPGQAPTCDDQIPCTLDSCDEGKHQCTHQGRNSACNNGQFCDGRERCEVGVGCVPGTAPVCDDEVACTVDSCDEDANSCAHAPNHGSCSNGQFCDGVEQCDLEEGCVGGTPPNCGDAVPCTVDSCNESADRCDHVPNDGLCSNGAFCDGTEVCNAASGCQAGPPRNCNDGIACTEDRCNEAADRCDHVADDGFCDNGKWCDGPEACSLQQGCQPGTPPDCDDEVGCTLDACIEASDTCKHTPFDTLCDDDIYCNGPELCDLEEDCQAGTPPSCDDLVACTDDRCVEKTESCSHRPDDSVCDNGLYCDGEEVCDELIGCHDGADPDCSDDVGCTIDTCVEEGDTCAHQASDDLCSNGSFCDGAETCDPELGCEPGTPPVCEDDIECTVDSCSDQAQACINDPDDDFCSNDLFCDGEEICRPDLGCVPGTPPNCADALACTTDTCVELADQCLQEPNGSLCGNGVVDPGCSEECDGTSGEICNNQIDDDGDMLVDCQDPDCAENPNPTCDDECRLVPPCRTLLRDPAVISLGGSENRSAHGMGAFGFHARLMAATPIDPTAEGFTVTLRNANGEIYAADLKAVDVKSRGRRYFFEAKDLEAIIAQGGGVVKLRVVQRTYQGQVGYGLWVRAIGDFSRATLARMTTQVYFGDDVGYVTADWSGAPGRWVLRQKDYASQLPQ